MLTIKRYPNRKLYDTGRKQYITLNGIAELIQSGQELQIIDHTSGEDLTTVTLSQIIFEQEKKQGGFLSKKVLTSLIRSSEDAIDSIKRTVTSPLDALFGVNEEIEHRMMKLIAAGEVEEAVGLDILDKLIIQETPYKAVREAVIEDNATAANEETIAVDAEAPESTPAMETYLSKLLAKRGIPTKNELIELTDQLDALSDKLEALNSDENA